MVPQSAYLPLPVMLRLTLKHIQQRLKEGARMVKCLPLKDKAGEVFRMDASASEDQATLGG